MGILCLLMENNISFLWGEVSIPKHNSYFFWLICDNIFYPIGDFIMMPIMTRNHLQILLTNTTEIKNLQANYALDPSRFNQDRILDACNCLLSMTPPLHTKIFMYYNDQKIPKQTFTVDEVSDAIINNSDIDDSIKKEIMFISALQMGVELEELYPKHSSVVERLLITLGEEIKEKIYKAIFQECCSLLQENLLP